MKRDEERKDQRQCPHTGSFAKHLKVLTLVFRKTNVFHAGKYLQMHLFSRFNQEHLCVHNTQTQHKVKQKMTTVLLWSSFIF
ncbi:TPA: hypothetical protein DCZ46_01700 [Candidatus Campbellbacteria bacterium]|uniref:Uncharacterized protein n=1 Tax=Candidatus Campbellbacteria bacterium RIFCSPLOWO2_01_FULL_34_15 TaxID=1797579 RepID=A0A1F5EPS0_9BACT|nr:MAG: hypothetical protein A2996_01770 [Candidatus Campbellbacteria bacterium RIFCSPLOWO2_01_FULL_34_15]HBC70658.1 hypothetical protein [Candidatus Campbellbacteria bacterium]